MPVYVSGLAPALRHSSANLSIEGCGPRTCRQSCALVGFRIVGLRTKDNTNDRLLECGVQTGACGADGKD